MGVAVGCLCVFRSGLAFGGVRVRCLCVRCVLCLLCLPLRVRPRVCPVLVLRFWDATCSATLRDMKTRELCVRGCGWRRVSADLRAFALRPDGSG